VTDGGNDHLSTTDVTDTGQLRTTHTTTADDSYSDADDGSAAAANGQVTAQSDSRTDDESGSGGTGTDESGLLFSSSTYQLNGTYHHGHTYSFHNSDTLSGGAPFRREHYQSHDDTSQSGTGWLIDGYGEQVGISETDTGTAHTDLDSESGPAGWVSFDGDSGYASNSAATFTYPDGSTSSGSMPGYGDYQAEWNGTDFTITFARLMPDITNEDGTPFVATGSYTAAAPGLSEPAEAHALGLPTASSRQQAAVQLCAAVDDVANARSYYELGRASDPDLPISGKEAADALRSIPGYVAWSAFEVGMVILPGPANKAFELFLKAAGKGLGYAKQGGKWVLGRLVTRKGVQVFEKVTEAEAKALANQYKAWSFGSRGVRTASKTVYNKKGVRIDFENPNPGQRPGQIHVQVGKAKFLYNPITRSFVGVPASLAKILASEEAQKAIQTALRMLGEL
jgi:hypothetical protein